MNSQASLITYRCDKAMCPMSSEINRVEMLRWSYRWLCWETDKHKWQRNTRPGWHVRSSPPDYTTKEKRRKRLMVLGLKSVFPSISTPAMWDRCRTPKCSELAGSGALRKWDLHFSYPQIHTSYTLQPSDHAAYPCCIFSPALLV